MDIALALRAARQRAELSQAALAARAGTSQATVSAYESGRKQPSVATLARLLAAAGARLSVEPTSPPVIVPSAAQLAHVDRQLVDVLALAEALPVRHRADLRFPRLDRSDPSDLDAVRSTLRTMVAADDPRFTRLAEAERRGARLDPPPLAP